ncbi:hypothetical protein NYO91_10230 [Arhodomonas aquaeolei]|uniref:SPOR domain-containing protein n=1 Tax=Arhodomonas aquaeolei TaxID=2369 RepID=UPI002168CC0D|nr:hypothetical protein [Arhodomonas aquaeolei]MCS4504452.1 hypothetical protein [Arhodomonas aquaeolei]
MQDADSLLQENGDIAARLDLACYLLRCTSNVVIVTLDGELTASGVAAQLARALAGGSETAAAIIDVTTAHNNDHLAERLLLDPGTDPGEPAAADQLSRRLRSRNLSLAVVVEDAHGLSARILQSLLTLSRLVSQRDANMPIALLCPEAEADRLEVLAQEAGRAADQIQRIRLAPPESEATAAAAAPVTRRRRIHPVWLAPPLGAVAVGVLTYALLAGGPDTGDTRTTSLDIEPEPASNTASATIADDSTTDGDQGSADPVARADTKRVDVPDTGDTPPSVSLPPEIAAGSALLNRPIPALPDALIETIERNETDTPGKGNGETATEIASADAAAPPASGAGSSDGETGTSAGEPTPAAEENGAPETQTASTDTAAEPAPETAKEEPDEEIPAEEPRTGEDWLASRDGGRYTLQLIAGRKQQTTANFLDAHPEVRDSARVVTVSGDDGTWHLVLLGDYPSRSAAMRDVPASIGADNVYPRRFSSVRN